MTLYEDAIELVGWFSTRKLNRDEILGRRMAKLPKRAFGGLYYIIIPVIGSNRELIATSLSGGRQVFFRLDENDPDRETVIFFPCPRLNAPPTLAIIRRLNADE